MIASLAKANPFYKLTRYISGLSKTIKPHLDAMENNQKNPFRKTKAIETILADLLKFRKQQTWLGAWLTGTDKLLHLLHKEFVTAEQKLDSSMKPIFKTEQQRELNNLPPYVSSQTAIMAHLKNRLAFLKNAPKVNLFILPHTFERFGINNQILVQSNSTGKPANYLNLKTIKDNNQAIIDSTSLRQTLSQLYNQRHETYANEAWQRASDEIDGAYSAKGYAERGLEWLKKSAPIITTDSKGKPSWGPGETQVSQERALYWYRYL